MTTTTVYAFRHGDHGKGVPKNILTPEAENACIAIGQKLAKMKVTFDKIVSSPQPRAIMTLIRIMQGMDKILAFSDISEGIGDARLGSYAFTDDEITKIVAAAKAAKKGTEEYMLEFSDIAEKMANRGEEGADYIDSLVKTYAGETIAFASHGGSRLEVTIRELMARSSHSSPVPIFETNGVAKLIFGNNNKLVSFKYLGVLV